MIYQFDFTKPFTITDYAAYGRWQKSNGEDIEITMAFYETVDKFFEGDLFELDIKEVALVIQDFGEALKKHLEAK